MGIGHLSCFVSSDKLLVSPQVVAQPGCMWFVSALDLLVGYMSRQDQAAAEQMIQVTPGVYIYICWLFKQIKQVIPGKSITGMSGFYRLPGESTKFECWLSGRIARHV